MTEFDERALQMLRTRGPMTAAQLGWALWELPGDRRSMGGGSAQANKFCRSAGRVLRRLERAGKAAGRFEDKLHVWRAL